MEEKLIAGLAGRIRAFEQGDPGPVMDPQAVAEVRDLLNRAVDADGGAPFEVLRVAAWLHWCRFLVLPAGQDQDDLDAATALFTPIARAAPEKVPDQMRQYLAADRTNTDPVRRAETATGLLDQVMQRNDPAGLDQGIALLTTAVAAIPTDHPDRARYLSNLGLALQTRFERTGATTDLDEAVTMLRQAATGTPTDHPNRAGRLSNLGSTLRIRFERTGAATDLDEAIRVGRDAVAAAPTDHPDHTKCLSNLGGALRAKFQRTGATTDLDEAVTMLREAVTATPTDHPDRAMYLSNLGCVLGTRFEHTGAATDLDEAVRVGREAVTATPTDHPDHTKCLSNLGLALLTRFERTGAATDLDEAVTVLRGAVSATPTDLPMHLSNLGGALRARFERTGAATDLDEAVRVGQEAVAATPTDHPDRAKYLSNLGGALRSGFVRTGAATGLDEAVTMLREAVTVTPTDHPDHAMYLSNLGGTLGIRFEHTGAATDLDEAVTMLREAVTATPTDHPDRAGRLTILGSALRARFERTRADADLDEAVHGWEQASGSPVALVTTRLEAAERWANTIARWQEPAAAVEAYAEAVNLLPLLAWRGISHRDQQHLLNTYAASLARDGAACAIAANRLDLAVELLEAGRGVYWSQLLGTRTDLTALQQAAPELAEQLRDCRTVLEQPIPERVTGLTPAQTVDGRMDAARRFDDLVHQVRALPPTDTFPHPNRFLTPPTVRTLLPGAGDDPVVVINISRWRCDALLLTHHGVTLVPLPNLTQDQVINEGNRYVNALRDFEGSLRDFQAVRRTDRLGLETAITTTLEWLWDHITAPVLTALGHTSTPTGRWPRLWWCPTGPLTALPVHAAGHHQTNDTVLDRVVSSYTPTLRALAHARTREAFTQPAKILVIALPDTPGQNPLPGTAAEHDLLTARLTPQARTVLTGPDATRHNVLTHLGWHRWLHASCHGTQNLADPATGGLLPYDWDTAGLVTVTDLTSPDHTGGEFAFLSACKTATGGVTNLDEAITVTAAMHHAGWRHVIGTLWSVWDDSATALTRDLYPQLLQGDGLDVRTAAYALHHAIRKVRASNPTRPSTWAPFIHTGP